MRAFGSSIRPLACGLIVALAAAAAPAQAAGDPASASHPKRLAGSTAAVLARLGTVPVSALQGQAAPASTAGTSNEGFFSSTKGKVALALFAAGVVITIVSRQKDAVHSPAR